MPRYIYPPRPKSKIHPRQLVDEEARGIWLWQRKFDGDRCVAVIDGKTVHLGNRHHKWHSPNKLLQLRKELAALKLPKGISYLDGELLKNGTLVLFDVLQLTKYLIGVNQLDRLDMLNQVCGEPVDFCQHELALNVSDHIWMADHGFSDFLFRFEEFCPYHSHPKGGLKQGGEGLIEGLVLRRSDSSLDNWGSNQYDVDWQVRCRAGKRNYRF